jgi:hypothetical protein
MLAARHTQVNVYVNEGWEPYKCHLIRR